MHVTQETQTQRTHNACTATTSCGTRILFIYCNVVCVLFRGMGISFNWPTLHILAWLLAHTMKHIYSKWNDHKNLHKFKINSKFTSLPKRCIVDCGWYAVHYIKKIVVLMYVQRRTSLNWRKKIIKVSPTIQNNQVLAFYIKENYFCSHMNIEYIWLKQRNNTERLPKN